jgi:hypothetical protein
MFAILLPQQIDYHNSNFVLSDKLKMNFIPFLFRKLKLLNLGCTPGLGFY